MPTISLAPVDYMFTGNQSCPVTFAFSYEERLDALRLQQSLQGLVARIPWLAGRLRAQADGSFAYEVADRPRLSLEVASSSKTFSELSDVETVQLVKSADAEPLVSARLTQTPTGSVLAVSMSHALVDGFSFFSALSKWAALTRGQAVEAPPVQRLLLPSEAHVAEAARELDAQSVLRASGQFWSEPRPAVQSLPRQERIGLSHAFIAEMVAEAQRDVDARLRDNDVLTAWLWRTYGARWWSLQGNPDVFMSCPVDVRRKLGEANKSAFGCNICSATSQASFAELLHAPLGELALRIQRSVAEVFADDWSRRVAPLEALRRAHGVSALHSMQLRHPRFGMLVTNMSRLPLGELDFGCGTPNDVKLFAEFGSMAAVLPARDGVTLAVYQPLRGLGRAPRAAVTADGTAVVSLGA